MLQCRWGRRALQVATCCLAATIAGLASAQDPRAFVAGFDLAQRQMIVGDMSDEGPTPWELEWLLLVAPVETDEHLLCKMLQQLGRSGDIRALGLIQTHAFSPVEDIADEAREALKQWLVWNHMMKEERKLPEPPHRFYGPPWPLPIAGYTMPSASGVPPGYAVISHREWKVAATGLGILASAHFASTIAGICLADDEGEAWWMTLGIPIAGPFIMGGYIIDAQRDPLYSVEAAVLFIDGSLQLAAAIATTAGLGSPTAELVPDQPLRVVLSPEGVALSGSF